MHFSHNIQILIVDDSELVLKFATRVLKDLNISLKTANNGREALDLMNIHPAEILVTDLMMPEMNGFELISSLRRNPRFRQTHIIVMTALDQVEDKVRALDLGANDYTVKPLDANEFRARVQAGLREILLKKQANDALESLDHELKMVAGLQQRLLPGKLPQGKRFQAAASYQPCRRAGGDYYDCFIDPFGRLVVTIADVSGHGASAAVLMAMFRALLKVFIDNKESSAGLVHRLNRALMDNIGDDPDFVSTFLGLIDLESLNLNFCSAGHGDMYILGPERGSIRRLEATGTVLGCLPLTWEERDLQLEPGQSLILYTDGLVEAINPLMEEYGRTRLRKLLLELDPGRTPAEMVDIIRGSVDTFVQDKDFSDDVTILVVGIT